MAAGKGMHAAGGGRGLTSRSVVQPALTPVVFSLLRSTYLPRALMPLMQPRTEPRNHVFFLELRRDSRVTMGITGFLLKVGHNFPSKK